MSLVELVRSSRIAELRKEKKDKLVEMCFDKTDMINELLEALDNQEDEHKEEIKSLRESNQATADLAEELYNSSHCYKYVKALLSDLVMTKEDLESTREALEHAQKNGYEDLINENQALRNKIVRMA